MYTTKQHRQPYASALDSKTPENLWFGTYIAEKYTTSDLQDRGFPFELSMNVLLGVFTEKKINFWMGCAASMPYRAAPK